MFFSSYTTEYKGMKQGDAISPNLQPICHNVKGLKGYDNNTPNERAFQK